MVVVWMVTFISCSNSVLFCYAQESEATSNRFGKIKLDAKEVPPPKNPYLANGGCLYSNGLSNKVRVCNSEDILPDSIDLGYCRLPDHEGLQYPEM